MKSKPIRVGDKFMSENRDIWEVIETKPGGVLELYCMNRIRFQRRYHREVKTWRRI